MNYDNCTTNGWYECVTKMYLKDDKERTLEVACACSGRGDMPTEDLDCYCLNNNDIFSYYGDYGNNARLLADYLRGNNKRENFGIFKLNDFKKYCDDHDMPIQSIRQLIIQGFGDGCGNPEMEVYEELGRIIDWDRIVPGCDIAKEAKAYGISEQQAKDYLYYVAEGRMESYCLTVIYDISANIEDYQIEYNGGIEHRDVTKFSFIDPDITRDYVKKPDNKSADDGKKLEIGSSFRFGTVGRTPIEWTVLDIVGNEAMLLCNRLFLNRTYNYDTVYQDEMWYDNAWSNDLEDLFFNKYLNEEEKAMISNRFVEEETGKFVDEGTDGAWPISFYILSSEEFMKYRDLISKTKGIWWLRDACKPYTINDEYYGMCSDSCACVIGEDNILSSDFVMAENRIRPVVWIKLDLAGKMN